MDAADLVMVLSDWLRRIGFVGFVAIVILQQLFGDKIALSLLRQGAQLTGRIRPNWKGILLYKFPPLACFAMILTGLCFGESGSAMVVLVLVALCGFVVFILPEAIMRLKLEGQQLRIFSRGKERACALDDVYSVYWDNCRGLTGKMMVLVMRDGKTFAFSMDTYLGVQSIFDLIHAHLSADKNN